MTAYQTVIDARISELLGYRQWYRETRWADWPDLRKENEVELRALVTLARKARRLQAAAPDPIAQYKSFADWTEGEKAEAWGR